MEKQLYIRLENLLLSLRSEKTSKKYYFREREGDIKVTYDSSKNPIRKDDLFLIREKEDYKKYIQVERERKLKEVCEANNLSYEKYKHQSSHILRNDYMDRIIGYAEINGFNLALVKRSTIKRNLEGFSKRLLKSGELKKLLEEFIQIFEEAFEMMPASISDQIKEAAIKVQIDTKPIEIFSSIYDLVHNQFYGIPLRSEDISENSTAPRAKRLINNFNNLKAIYDKYLTLIFESHIFEPLVTEIPKLYLELKKEEITSNIVSSGLKHWNKSLLELLTEELKEKLINSVDYRFELSKEIDPKIIKFLDSLDSYLGKSDKVEIYTVEKNHDEVIGTTFSYSLMLIEEIEYTIFKFVSSDEIKVVTVSSEGYNLYLEIVAILKREKVRIEKLSELNFCIDLLEERLGFRNVMVVKKLAN